MHAYLKSRRTLPKQKSHTPVHFPYSGTQGLLVPLTWCQSMNPHKMMLDYREYSNSSEATEEETRSSSSTATPRATTRKNKRISRKYKRRFSDTQIKLLESMFETESRVEPVKKLELARELGLQPRQVAIWFQNKRARWKSKQLERDYNILLANHNNLASRFDALKKEHKASLIQLQKLKDGMQKPLEEHKAAANSMDSESENADTVKPTPCPSSSDGSEHVRGVEDETGLRNLNLVEHAGNSLILPPEDYWGIFDSNNLFDQSTIDYQWWEFWS